MRENCDVSLPGEKQANGHLHPFSQAINQLADIFLSMGFEVVEGPELETDFYNFQSLNYPPFHPARDMQDTYFVKNPHGKENLVLRTHTSNVQVRTMEKRTPPLRVCTFGRCFRHDAIDASHEQVFYQVEGFVVDKEISVSNLIFTMKSILSAFFEKEVEIRLHPSYFPFTEPSYEISFTCVNCNGRGCSLCNGSGWLEIGGSGMIHPNVLKAAGYKEGEWQGFAFGWGLDRLTMLKYKINDVRWFHSGDLRFIRQF